MWTDELGMNPLALRALRLKKGESFGLLFDDFAGEDLTVGEHNVAEVDAFV
jgi:hypothetical protein